MTIHETNPFDTTDNRNPLDSHPPLDDSSSPRWDADSACPRCDRPVEEGAFPALSRADNASYICSDCGIDEAMTNLGYPQFKLPGPTGWPLTDWTASGEQIGRA